jgi:RNA polymerase sigma factor (sigma-70 family)
MDNQRPERDGEGPRDGENLSDGKELFQANLSLIKRIVTYICARAHLTTVEAQDFQSHVSVKLIEHAYARLGEFKGQSTLKSFLFTVVRHLFQDYRNSLWGKWRPSAEAHRRGDLAILLERLMSRDEHPFDEACELMWTNHGVAASRQELDALRAALPIKPRRRIDSDEVLVDVPVHAPGPYEQLDMAERERQLTRLLVVLREIVETLPDQDRLILTLLYWDGRSIADIARILDLNQKALYPRIRRLLKDLRKTLEKRGFDGGALPEI